MSHSKLGHVHLKVRDLDRSIEFYRTLLGLAVTERVNDSFAFLSFGSAHHDLALQALGPNAMSESAGNVGLYHIAFELDDPAQLLFTYEKLKELIYPCILVDHGISWALYSEDPDGIGLEFYIDRRAEIKGSNNWNGKSSRLTEDDLRKIV